VTDQPTVPPQVPPPPPLMPPAAPQAVPTPPGVPMSAGGGTHEAPVAAFVPAAVAAPAPAPPAAPGDLATSYNGLGPVLTRAVREQWFTLVVAVLSGWGFLWLATLAAMVGAIVGAIGGMFGLLSVGGGGGPFSATFGQVAAPTEGVLGLFGGAIGGAVVGFTAIAGPALANPIGILEVIVGGSLATLVLFFGYWVTEPWMMDHHVGARRMSERERAIVVPMLLRASHNMGMGGALPRIRILDDRANVNAFCSMRHIVLHKSLLINGFPPEAAEAICGHELGHWQRGDAIVMRLITCACWPVSVTMNIGLALARTGHKAAALFAHVVFWPSYVLRQHVIAPMSAAGGRDCEYAADALAGRAGYALALREAFERLGDTESTPLDVQLATHPPMELRIEALDLLTRSADAQSHA
jgi:Zn-dependent protease with chaperone function